MPVVGDSVVDAKGRQVDIDGWKLAAGAVAIVEAVGDNGDFKLRNPMRQVSGWQKRKFYAYTQVTATTALTKTTTSTATTTKITSTTSTIKSWLPG
jgi:hypothetical protein